MKKFTILEHTADLAIKGYGKDLPELFSNLALAMYKEMIEKSQIKQDNQKHCLEIRGDGYELLLINFLNELLLLSDTEHLALAELQFLQFNKQKLKVCGSFLTIMIKKLDIKAATFHNLKIQKEDNYFTAVVIFDI